MEHEDYLSSLKEIYETYYSASWKLQGFRRPGTKFFGIGSGPKGDACHTQFAADVKALIERMTKAQADHLSAMDVLRYVVTEPENKEDDQLVYWMLVAIHGEAAPLAGLLQPEEAGELAGLYDRIYPRRTRFPAQKQCYAALEKRAAEKT